MAAAAPPAWLLPVLLLPVLLRAAPGPGLEAQLCGYTWEATDTDRQVLYKINFCDPIEECEGSSAVCAYDLNKKTYLSVGDSSLRKSSKTLLEFNTTRTCSQEGTEHMIQSNINFLCGKTLGTPEFVTATECVHYFEWRTFVACKKDLFKAKKEVPCYVFDGPWKKHDLNPLIKISGSYLVDDSDDDSLYINVCRDIESSDDETRRCPEGSAACLLKKGHAFDVGRPKEQLKLLGKDRLVLSYEKVYSEEEIPDFCLGHNPAVTITFVCPSKRGGESTSPKLTAKINCRYEIEWVTEYACHRDYLESRNCSLTNEQHDISIDLTPLTQPPGYVTPYMAKDERQEYYYYLNICGKTTAGNCRDNGGYVSSCQVKSSNYQQKVAGKFENQTLRYSDGDLTLTYPNGDACSSGFQRMTVINFECNETASNDGKGAPVFTGEVDCTYFFTWDTKYACVKEKEDILCRVADKKKRYDLSPLTRSSESAQNWEAVDSSLTEAEKKRYYINVCHKVLKKGGALGCPDDAAICSVDKQNKAKNLGTFMSSPQKVGESIQLVYQNGDSCLSDKKIKTVIMLVCKPGDLESAPVLISENDDECLYEFEWHTAAACVLSKTEGDNCRVSDSQAGFSFDLSPLTKKSGSYIVHAPDYDFYINICDRVPQESCPGESAACQVSKSNHGAWSLGALSSKLSYYDGMIQLTYKNGTPYNNENQTPRSTLITFLCDREAGIGQPEYQKEDSYTYNFKWYTEHACPEMPLECIVTDPTTMQQYDLSRLSKSEKRGENWYAMDNSEPNQRRKYYINICRPLIPVPGCDRHASVCQMKYERDYDSISEVPSISNLGVASKGLVIERPGRVLLTYTGGSVCINADGQNISYTTVIHFTCSEGTLGSSPRFIDDRECVITFLWETEAACPVKTTRDETQSCSVRDPNSGFLFNLQPLASEKGYKASGTGKSYMLNICGPAPDCGNINGKPAAGCETDLKSVRTVELDKTLRLSTEGLLTLTYKGPLVAASGTSDTFTITFICNNSYPGELRFVREETSTSKIHHAFFEFYTALACTPAPVDCQVTDLAGNEYDLSDLSKEHEPWVAVDTSKNAKTRTFYLNVCKPLPYGPGCPGGAVGSCVKYADRSQNLGIIQISPQVTTGGSLSIIYLNGDICKDKQRYSTRIIFQCDQTIGSPVFEEEDGCEFVFIWRTLAACPLHRAEGDKCQVTDPRYGYVYNLKPLSVKDMKVSTDEYDYYFRVCGTIAESCKSVDHTVSSCQVKKTNSTSRKIAGLYNEKLTFENGLIKINYTSGERCHKIYERSTTILFYCDNSALEPMFLKETPDCTYLFEWHTPYACLPLRSVECYYKDSEGNSFDLSSLTRHRENWEAISMFGSAQRYYINVCKSLVTHGGAGSCPLNAAACLVDGSSYINIGEVAEGPRWENGITVLKYVNGDKCPDKIRKKMTILRLKCDESKVESKPELVTALEDCEYTFLWFTAAACPLTNNMNNDCRVTNPVTGHLFDLNSLKREAGYTLYDNKSRKTVQLGICDEVKSSCGTGVGVCISDGQKHIIAGRQSKMLTYQDQVLKLVYEGGDPCPVNSALKHRSHFSFVCKSDAGDGQPVLLSFDEQTCTHYFSWHTSLACEEEVKCSVLNGSSVIDLSPLIHRTGYYEAFDDDDLTDLTPDFYINICEPLNPIKDVSCPPGAAVCMVPVTGPPIDIGRITEPPTLNPATNEVHITFNSTTPCPADRKLNYTSLIVFQCERGIALGKPKMIRRLDCSFVFEWGTPLVCPDQVKTSGCSVTDEQLHYTFDLSSLSKNTYKILSGSNSYHVGVCAKVVDVPQGKCKDGAVCLVSENSAASFGNFKEMKMDYRHQDETVILQYTRGDQCPPVTEKGELCVFPFKYKDKNYEECITDGEGKPWCSTTKDYDRDGKWGFCGNVVGNRESTIIFKCDENAGEGTPQLLSETLGCAVTFEWKTQVVCPPQKMECKFIQKHKTYDLRVLSSLTGSWVFSYEGSSYYMNLCQRVYEGPTGCSDRASICKKSQNGAVQVLGLVHTQKLNVTDDKVYISYSGGQECSENKKTTTVIELKCAKTVGKPVLQRFDGENCAYYITWETRAACAVKPQEVEIVNGTVINPTSGKNFSLGDIFYKLYTASGDIRTNGDTYVYEIQLSSITDSAHPQCSGANICQVKTNSPYQRRVGSSNKAKYYIQDNDLDIVFSSDSQCGKDRSKFVSSTIFFHCDLQAKEGIPEFLHETSDCQYLFTWYTSAVCPLAMSEVPESNEGQIDQEAQIHKGLSGRSQAVGAVLSVLLVVLTVCLLILLFYKKERRETVMHKITNCCRRTSSVSYKYTKVNSEEEANENETEWLMEEIAAPNQKPGKGGQENGHITKSVTSDAFTSLHVDDMDSEDEVLTIPDVKVHSARGPQSRGSDKNRHQQKKPPSHGRDDKASLLNGGKESKTAAKLPSHQTQDSLNSVSFHDDSDEDLLNV
ncbi:cation-independent mannose-6-phosphate receptor [Alligator mississippiensis]|uniref:cation-independent mannose-6-phosphate receptor n=1 Tax=Alligator mississippiensis TaxID=8496 RepID=UPI00287793E0|nr:cation-independent mannose-6-phosphate receptor [Alligator mississippiensis]